MSCYRFTIGWPGAVLLFLWAGGNVALFWVTFAKYMWNIEYMYVFSLVGFSLSFSRGAAQALNFNCALILLPICRNLISLLRGCFGLNKEQCCGPNAVCRQLDRNIFFHKIVGYTICFWTAIHYIGHCFNVERFVNAARDSAHPSKIDISKYEFNGTWVNPVRLNSTNAVLEVLTLFPGWSGLIALVVLIIMASASMESVRRKFHEVFWYTHHLFVIFYIFIIIHGFGGVIKSQINYEDHDPKYCYNKTKDWGNTDKCPLPIFAPSEADTWMWVTGPLILYAIETIMKLISRFRKVEIVDACIHPSDVLELKMKKDGFKSNAGQYISIMCPSLSYFQWHPFTLTSAPEDDYFSVHIRVVGDWTENLTKIVKELNKKKASKTDESIIYPRVSVDGPFGTCCEDVFRYNVVMLIGAGIGVTPFASILKHIWYMYTENKEINKLKKVYFLWICRDKAFMWFNEMLKHLEDKMQEAGSDDFMSIQIYLTNGWNEDIQKKVIETISHPTDVVTELKSKTEFGRPNWESVFKRMAAEHPNEEVGVFFCGPKALTKSLRTKCEQHSNLVPQGRPRFIFHKENF